MLSGEYKVQEVKVTEVNIVPIISISFYEKSEFGLRDKI